jgi:hypothetical protein
MPYLPNSQYCTVRPLDCSDPYSILISSIVSLAEVSGSTPTDILSAAQTLCVDETKDWTLDDVQQYIVAAVKRGILVIATSSTYAVNAGMARVNPINAKYFCVSQLFDSGSR